MALFRILKGLKAKLPTTYTEGYCYVTTDEHKMYVDSSNAADGRFALNAANADTADTATKLSTSAGSNTKPIYFSGGKPVAINNNIGTATQPMYMSSGELKATTATVGSNSKPMYMENGTLKAFSGTIGSASVPVYVNAGVVTQITPSGLFSVFSQTSGTTAGPVLSITVAGQNRTVTLKSASGTESGVVTTGAQTFAGTKTFASIVSNGAVTIGGHLTANGRISVTAPGGNWSSGRSNAAIQVGTTSAESYHPIIMGKTSSGHYYNLGAYQDLVGFYGHDKSLTTNATSSSITFNPSTGAVKATGTITAPTFIGNLSGNANTASKWQTARTITYNGDITGSVSIDGGSSPTVSISLVGSGVTAGSYGPSANASPGVSGSFSVPYFTVDAKGRITAASTKTITLPTDTKVTNTLSTTTKAYITGTASGSTNTGTQYFDTGVYLSTTAGELVATKFTGALNGNANTATALQTARAIDGILFNGSANVTRYATCATAAATAAKTASVTSGTFSLITGARVTIKFTYANTVASPTLNVNSTGGKAIYWHGAALPSSQYWEAGAVIDFVYNGTQWEIIGVAKDNNTTYAFSTSNPTLSWGTTSTIGTAGGVTYKVTMPSNPNTHYTTRVYAGASGTAANASTSNPYVKITDDNTYRNQIRLIGSGATSVSSDASGNITISSTNTTYSSLKNPYSLTIQANGTSLGSYDGSSAKTFNITPSNIGAAASSHSHSYLPLSGGTLSGILNCFGGGLKIGTSSESVTLSYDTSSDTLSITFP